LDLEADCEKQANFGGFRGAAVGRHGHVVGERARAVGEHADAVGQRARAVGERVNTVCQRANAGEQPADVVGRGTCAGGQPADVGVERADSSAVFADTQNGIGSRKKFDGRRCLASWQVVMTREVRLVSELIFARPAITPIDKPHRLGPRFEVARWKSIIDSDPSAEALGYYQTSATRTKMRRAFN